MKGIYGKVLYIDLGKRESEAKKLDEFVLEKYLGGKGLGIKLLLENNPPKIDPFSPKNTLIIAGGPLTGSSIWGCCRYGLYTKSPLTGFFAESYSGGDVGDRLAETGYDAVVIRGASSEPIWLEIGPNGVYFHSAVHLWGKDTYETEDLIKQWIKENRIDVKRCGVICIGPAGENLVRFAVVENNYWRSAGRTGLGALLGSKKVKAIAFFGFHKKKFADPKGIKNFIQEIAKIGKDNPGVKAYKSFGTPMMVDIMNEAGAFPTRYWRKGRAEHRDSINAKALHTRCDVKPNACPHCFFACGRVSVVKEGRHKGLKIEGPEYETIYSFGGLCEIKEIEEIIYLNDLCDRLGLDTITAGNLVGLTIEASRQKKIDYQIDYGEVDKVAELLQDIAYKRGIGEILSQGIISASKAFGLEDQAIHVKGMEPAGYDPRVLKGMALSYATSDRGACHLRTTFYKPELSGMVDPEQIQGKAKILVEWEDRLIIFDTLILCRFYRDMYEWDKLSYMIKITTGMNLDTASLRKISSRIKNDIRRFNLQEGLKKEHDSIPHRFYTEALPETGKSIHPEQMEQMLSEYYKERGWDENGIPF